MRNFKLFFILFLSTIFSIFLYKLSTQEWNEQTAGDLETKNEIKKSISKNSNLKLRPSETKVTNCSTSSNTQLMSVKPISSINSSTNEIFKLTAIAKNNPNDILALSQKKEDVNEANIASIAVFNIAKTCFQLKLRKTEDSKNMNVESTNSVCQTLSENILRDPLIVLENSANGGSVLAKTFYLMNSFEFSQIYKEINTTESNRYSIEILEKAEQFGSDAVKEGVREANLLMSRAYISGLFGLKDLTKGVGYLLPVSENMKSKEFSEYVSKLDSQLNDFEKNRTREIAFGCIKVNEQVFNSPF